MNNGFRKVAGSNPAREIKLDFAFLIPFFPALFFFSRDVDADIAADTIATTATTAISVDTTNATATATTATTAAAAAVAVAAQLS